MARTIAIANQKGGVGKTTTAINLSYSLSEENKKVLLIDLDEQANATIGLGFKRELIEHNSFDLLTTSIDICDTIYTKNKMLSIIPANNKLANVENDIINTNEKEQILNNKLKDIKNNYDYIILDCPPSLGLIIDNALYASDSVIIPVECEYFAYDGLTQMVKKINEVQQIKQDKLTIEGILITKLDNRNLFGYKMTQKIKDEFPEKTFKTIISRSSHIQEAPMHGKSVMEFAFNSRGSKEYRQLALEIIKGENNG